MATIAGTTEEVAIMVEETATVTIAEEMAITVENSHEMEETTMAEGIMVIARTVSVTTVDEIHSV